MFKNVRIGKVVLWLTIIMVASFLVAGGLFYLTGDVKMLAGTGVTIIGKYNKDINEEKTLELADINNLNINSISTDINFILTDESIVKAHLYGTVSSSREDYYPSIEVNKSGDTGTIKEKWPSGGVVGFFNGNLKLDIYLPRSYSRNIRIDTSSANVAFDGLNLKNFECETVSGNVKAINLTAEGVGIKTSSGDLNLGIKSSGNVEVNSVSGDIKATGVASKALRLSTSSGNFNFNTIECKDFDYNSVAGDLNVDSIKAINSSAKTSSGTLRLNGQSTGKVYMHSVSGDLTWEGLITESTQIDTSSGKTTLKGSIGDLKFNSVAGDIEADYTEFSNNLSLESSSGNIKLKLPSAAEFGIDYKSSSGNVKLDGFEVTLKGSIKDNSLTGYVKNSNNNILIRTVAGDATISKN